MEDSSAWGACDSAIPTLGVAGSSGGPRHTPTLPSVPQVMGILGSGLPIFWWIEQTWSSSGKMGSQASGAVSEAGQWGGDGDAAHLPRPAPTSPRSRGFPGLTPKKVPLNTCSPPPPPLVQAVVLMHWGFLYPGPRSPLLQQPLVLSPRSVVTRPVPAQSLVK